MTDVKRLLDEATPLPWRVLEDDDPEGTGILGGGEEGSIDEGQVAWAERFTGAFPDKGNAALIVHAVNRLPDYEAAVDALESFVDSHHAGYPASLVQSEDACEKARALLARLRGKVAADV